MAGCERFELDMIDCLDGALDGERLAALEEHLRVCPACSHRLETMRVLMEETAALCVDVPDGLHDRILQRVARERKGGRLLRFASRRTIAAAAAVVLVCAASVYGVSRLYGQKGTDTASLERQLLAENYASSSTGDGAASGDADAGDASMDGSSYSHDEVTPENGEVINDAAPAECDAADIAERDPADTSGMADSKTGLFSNLAEDARYASVVVMDIEEVPAPLAAYTLQPGVQSDLEKDEEKQDEVYFVVVSVEEADEILKECQAEEVKLTLYDTENPVPDEELIDTSSAEALFILQITK